MAYDRRTNMRLPIRVVISLALGCGSGPKPVAPTNNAGGETLEAARAAELGTDGPRDYARAAAIYTRLCQEGKGSLEACVALLDATLYGVGVPEDRARYFELSKTLCSRGDSVSCVVKIWADADELARDDPERKNEAARDALGHELEAQLAKLEAACSKSDGRACETMIMWRGGDGSSAEEARNVLFASACAHGRLDACASHAIHLEFCEEADDVAVCEQEQVAEWKSDDPDRYASAVTLIEACSAGDARACVHVPSKRIPMKTRCEAHDFEACGQLGCLGDKASDAIAKQNGVSANCQIAWRLGTLEAKRGTLPPAAKLE